MEMFGLLGAHPELVSDIKIVHVIEGNAPEISRDTAEGLQRQVHQISGQRWLHGGHCQVPPGLGLGNKTLNSGHRWWPPFGGHRCIPTEVSNSGHR